jgi:hypothetical protein
MTSTGRGDFGAKSSSRILRLPGGGTNINIFAYSDEPAKPVTAKSSSTDVQEMNGQPTQSSQPADPLPTNDVDESAAADGDVVEEDKEDKAVDDELTAVAATVETETQAVADSKPTATRSSDVDTNLKKGRAGGSGFNPITGEPYSSNNNTQTQDSPKSQIRVRQPPGGASTKLW